ncbi:hypothetical protein I4F81_005215 [Pyropia yezoensis]|uniref:Uncharacterized protein n=1 Tax=Pyropia yezoensis TaxID=2788 RepID=A0ACC3BYN7_PYRYE|nr:hypothetical protein I4F81_005215 [Neopyropia yezoensis]
MVVAPCLPPRPQPHHAAGKPAGGSAGQRAVGQAGGASRRDRHVKRAARARGRGHNATNIQKGCVPLRPLSPQNPAAHVGAVDTKGEPRAAVRHRPPHPRAMDGRLQSE